jgi:phosphatidate cytidylyltransferase
MRLGLSLNEAYLLVLAGLVLLAIIGTGYGQWAIRRAVSPEQIARIRVVNSRVRMGWWLILIFTIAFSLGHNYLLAVFGIISFFLFREFVALTPTRPSDHWALVASFYIVIPVQYVLIGLGNTRSSRSLSRCTSLCCCRF